MLSNFLKSRRCHWSSLVVFSLFVLVSCNVGAPNKEAVYKVIDEYFAEKGDEQIEAAIERIIEKKRKGPSVDDMLKKRVDVTVGQAAVKGPEDAPITIVEFSDFQCPYCQAVLPSIEKVMKDNPGKIKLAFRHNSLPRHPHAETAHIASLAAKEQGKFWEFHDILFKNQKEWGQLDFKDAATKHTPLEAKMVEYAKSFGIDPVKFKADMENNREAYLKILAEDANFARANGAGGTPSFFFNGALIVGLRPPEFFQQVVDKLLAEKS